MYKIYYVDVNRLMELFSYEELYSKVATYRKNKVDRLMFYKDRWLSLAAEYLLMQSLNEFNIDYSKIQIGFVENNKPVLKNCEKKLYFNLSHSGEMAMCVVADCEIGCDIQKMSDKENFIDIAERFFDPYEVQMIKNAKGKEQKELFYRIWVLKESYIKATGKGLQTPLKSFRICIEHNIPMVFINNELDTRFIFEEKNVGNEIYKSAVCRNVGKNL